MTNKEKADQQASPKDLRVHDTSGNAQRARLLAYLRQHGSINTFEAIRLLNILRPGARIAELRAKGHNIVTHLGTLKDDQGREHQNVATYYLSADPAGKVAA
ncbi:helix-turn-helix domain-containing protein [Pseudomonas nitroreducens]|uniref:helix-turn-helix domain-containing protein n=1 Tax=Pseudomonas nitroreducens TaxID=46680 RepID=UPI003CC82425